MNNEEYNEWEQFVQSLIDNKDKPLLMTHKPSEVRYCSKYFGDYLTEDELQERQFSGRFWTIRAEDEDDPTILFIILDNELVLCVHKEINGKMVEDVRNRDYMKHMMPDCLRGCYYND